ncbi:MAG: stage IV sporulation protein A [Firmicutes bacterium]|nr:stage IV sporulation protein A [Bacillota bacterium]
MDRNLYRDIGERTGGEIHIGVVGPVRTGKSTFIKRFMELFVLPEIENLYVRSRVVDQLPQSGDGRTIMTAEPKFVPEEAVQIQVAHSTLSVRMVDCVGYMVPGVLGHMEDDRERMVQTPWKTESLPFSEAAAIGTEKVIHDHSTVGVLVTADGTFGELPRESYVAAEEKTAEQLKALRKPFVIVLNTAAPYGEETEILREQLADKYGVPVLAVDCSQMNKSVPEEIFGALLSQFPMREIHISLPEYMEALSCEHPIKAELIDTVFAWMEGLDTMGSVEKTLPAVSLCNHVQKAVIDRMEMSTGRIYISLQLQEGLYYQIIGELLHRDVQGDRELFLLLQEYAKSKEAYDEMREALDSVTMAGYGIVHPKLHQMKLGEPEVFKQGNKYGVRLVATAPCLHMIKTDISTEISPIVGSQQQSEDLAKYLLEKAESPETEIWDTNLFGKTLRELVTEQMDHKLRSVPDTLQFKVQRSLQKISNEGKDYFICIIL